jgi:conjugal transfer pilus assembly protein TraF
VLALLVDASVAEAADRIPTQVATLDATDGYFDRHAEGWFWYRDPPVDEAPPPEPPSSEAPATTDDDPIQRIAAQRHAIDVALNRAILEPTPEHMGAYLRLNQQLMAQAGRFAEAWRGAIWRDPALDYSLVSPVGAAAYVKADQDSAEREQRLAAAAQRWGLLFFFRGSCPYCHRLAPLLRQFSMRYGFRVVDVSLDGGGLPEFPHPQANARAAEALGVEAVPAVYLLDPRGRRVLPASFGYVGWSDLQQRIDYAIGQADHPDASAADAPLTAGALP